MKNKIIVIKHILKPCYVQCNLAASVKEVKLSATVLFGYTKATNGKRAWLRNKQPKPNLPQMYSLKSFTHRTNLCWETHQNNGVYGLDYLHPRGFSFLESIRIPANQNVHCQLFNPVQDLHCSRQPQLGSHSDHIISLLCGSATKHSQEDWFHEHQDTLTLTRHYV